MDSEAGRAEQLRAKIAGRPTLNLVYRVVIGIVGTAVLVLGIIAIPYPGPGWAIVFAGLAILATEFSWARSALHWVKARYNRFMAWFRAQGMTVKLLGVALTTAVVLLTLWVLDAFGMVGGWIGLDWPWLRSPLKS